MKKLELQKCIVGSVYTNCYFLKNKETGELLIVDPGDAADTIERKVSEMQGKPVGILLAPKRRKQMSPVVLAHV